MKHVSLSLGLQFFSLGFFGLMFSCVPSTPHKDSAERNLNDVNSLLREHTCLACHAESTTLVGPSYLDIGKRNYTDEQIIRLIKYPVPENWPGFPPMAAVQDIPEDDALKIARWINTLDQ
jgi:cytochrome c